MTNKELIELTNKYGTLTAMIFTYNLDKDLIDKIIEKLSNYRTFNYPDGVPKEIACNELRGYLWKDDSVRSKYFKFTCMMSECDNLLSELKANYESNKNIRKENIIEHIKTGGKKLNNDFRKDKFKELNNLKNNIDCLMAFFQNPMSITDENIAQFENDKNKLIDRINKISNDLKVEYNKLYN